MRVLMLTQTYAPVLGGVERVVEDLSVELARRGHEVGVATLGQPGGEPPTSDGVDVHLLGSAVHRLPGLGFDEERRHAPPAPDPETVRGLRRLLRRVRPDVVHAHNWLANSYLPLASRSDAAFVLSLHDYGLVCATKRLLYRGTACSGPGPYKCARCASEYYGPRGLPVAAAVRLSLAPMRRNVDLFLPVSEAVAERSGIGPGDRSRVVPNLVGELPQPPLPDDGGLAALPDEPFLLYCGDVTPDKGAACLLEAYGQLREAPPLVLVGRDFLGGTLPAGATAVGPLPHRLAIEAARRSLFSIVPSILPETFGLAALEAAAVGRPVIAAAVGGLPEVVRDGETGLLVPPGDAEALAAAMRRLLADAPLRARQGEAALARAREFAPDRVVPEFEEAYGAALETRRARRGRVR